MRHTLSARLLSLAMSSTALYAQTATAPAIGDGSEDNPYVIASLDNLYWLSQARDSTLWSKHFIQTTDIDASDSRNWDVVSDTARGFLPIGYASAYFSGSYNGKGHVIYGLYINRASLTRVGLFGYTAYAVIDSLRLVNGSVNGGTFVGLLAGAIAYSTVSHCFADGVVNGMGYVGGLIGYNTSASLISESYSSGSVSGANYAGGLAGVNYYKSTIQNSHSSAFVSGSSYSGGLTGESQSSTITDCFSSGNVDGGYYAGGLVGNNSDSAKIINGYSTGDIRGTYTVGGLVGQNYYGSSISNSYSSGRVTGGSIIGGLVGDNASPSRIGNSYSTGDVTGVGVVGGLVGQNHGLVENSFSSGTVKGTTATVGGLVGTGVVAMITNSYWDADVSGISTGNFGTAMGNAEIKREGSFTAWDFGSTWGIREDTTYPALQSENNAPFAFPDSIQGSSINLSAVLANDYDYETLQSALAFRMDTCTCHFGSISGDAFSFSGGAVVGSTDTLVYRIGEILADGDTLWGNRARAVLTYDDVVNARIALSGNSQDQISVRQVQQSLDLQYRTSRHGNVDILFCNLSGVPVLTLHSGLQNVGDHRLMVDAGIQPGLYISVLQIDGKTVSQSPLAIARGLR